MDHRDTGAHLKWPTGPPCKVPPGKPSYFLSTSRRCEPLPRQAPRESNRIRRIALTLIKKLLLALRCDGGQATALIVPVLGLFMAAGVLVVDIGLIFSDRRDAQGDADHAALAGAISLTLNASQTSTAANAAAVQFLTANDYKSNDPTATYQVTVSKDCYSANDGAETKSRSSSPASRPVAAFWITSE